MIQVIYTSEATDALSSGEVFRIVTTSSTNNDKNDLTGFLIYSGERFFQLIEGPVGSIDALLSTLKRDPRHTNIIVKSRLEVTERAFPKWRMKRVGETLSPLELSNRLPDLDHAPYEVRKAVAEFLSPASIR